MAKKKEIETEVVVMNLAILAPVPGSKRKRKRIGFGEGSGNGKTCGKGQKGQTSRSGYNYRRGFEGGQMPLHRRLPKVGFTSRKKTAGVNDFVTISLEQLAKVGATGEVTLQKLSELGLVRSLRRPVKILGGSECKSKLIIEAHAFTASAKAAIESAGGEARVVS